MIARWLLQEIETVLPRYETSAPREVVVRRLDDEPVAEVKPAPIDPKYGRNEGVTIRDHVLRMLREHGPMPQREIFTRMMRLYPGSKEGTIRGCTNKALDILDEHGLARRCAAPRDVVHRVQYWEAVT